MVVVVVMVVIIAAANLWYCDKYNTGIYHKTIHTDVGSNISCCNNLCDIFLGVAMCLHAVTSFCSYIDIYVNINIYILIYIYIYI